MQSSPFGLGLLESQAAGVVDELDVGPVNALTLVFFLLVLEYVLVEVILQVFVISISIAFLYVHNTVVLHSARLFIIWMTP